jgi:hypothetical protein
MTQVFISYSHSDEALRADLEKHLSLLKRQGLVDIWSDHCIRPGEAFGTAISAGLESSNIVLLLISVDFLNSDYCFSIEMTRAMEKHARGDAVVVPIILRPCDWHSAPFGQLKALPTDGKPVTKWTTLDDAFLDIVTKLRQLVSNTRGAVTPVAQKSSQRPESAAASTSALVHTEIVSRSSNLALPRQFTDQDQHDFVEGTFKFISNYFEGSLHEMQTRNTGITVRMVPTSQRAFSAIIFRDGERQAGCHVRIGGGFNQNGIAYSASEHASNNSYNELLSVNTDKHSLFLKATMGMFNGAADAKLTEEGAAEHLWSMFISPLQR